MLAGESSRAMPSTRGAVSVRVAEMILSLKWIGTFLRSFGRGSRRACGEVKLYKKDTGIFIHTLCVYSHSKGVSLETFYSTEEMRMTKTQTTVTIDVELKERAKARGLNLSKVLQEALRERFDIDALREERDRLDKLIRKAEEREAARREEVERKLKAAKQGFERGWQEMSASEREEWLEDWAEDLDMRPQDLLEELQDSGEQGD